MEPQLVYIASAYTIGDVAKNVAAQMDTAHFIMDLGHAPMAPLLSHFLHIHRQRPYQEWLKVDLMIIPRCDVLIRLKGESSGADKEVEVALKNNIPVFYELDDLVTWLKS